MRREASPVSLVEAQLRRLHRPLFPIHIDACIDTLAAAPAAFDATLEPAPRRRVTARIGLELETVGARRIRLAGIIGLGRLPVRDDGLPDHPP